MDGNVVFVCCSKNFKPPLDGFHLATGSWVKYFAVDPLI